MGYSIRDKDESFENFYFGGFGNNWIDYQTAKRYREYYTFPGVGINEIVGTNFGKSLIEWTLPPLRFRRLGFVNIYCNWLHTTFFSSVIGTNIDHKSGQQIFMNVGSQLDLKIVLFSRLESTLSVGYAFAWEKNHKPTKELMVSLRIM